MEPTTNLETKFSPRIGVAFAPELQLLLLRLIPRVKPFRSQDALLTKYNAGVLVEKKCQGMRRAGLVRLTVLTTRLLSNTVDLVATM